jgi:hypothetical protein
MSFGKKVDEHIDAMLAEGVLPDVEEIIEMEVPGQQAGPQASGDEGGPKSAPAARFPWLGKTWAAKFFGGASKGGEHPTDPADGFSKQNRAYPPAKFSGASTSGVKEDEKIDPQAVVDAVLADLETIQDADE